MTARCVAVVGAGFGGTLLSLHLLRHCPPETRVVPIERNARPGAPGWRARPRRRGRRGKAGAGGAAGGMDEMDRKLLELLQQDATLSVAQLADRVGLSTTPCWKRVQKLEASGVITRRVALVAPERVGVGPSVFVAVQAGEHTPAWMRRFTDAVSAMPEVMEVWRMAGEVDCRLRVAVAGMAEFDAFYKRPIETVPMRDATSRSAMERLRHTTAYPLQPGASRDRRAPEKAEEA